MQVEVHDVKAHVARTSYAHNGVEVCAVVVEQAAGFVNYARDLFDVGFEKTER